MLPPLYHCTNRLGAALKSLQHASVPPKSAAACYVTLTCSAAAAAVFLHRSQEADLPDVRAFYRYRSRRTRLSQHLSWQRSFVVRLSRALHQAQAYDPPPHH